MGQQLQRQKSIPAYMTLFYFATLLVLGSVRVFLWPAVENEEQEELDQVLQPVCVCSFTSDALPGALSVPGRVRTSVCNEDTHQLQGSASGRNSFFPCFCELCLPKSPRGQRDPKCSCASKEQLKLQAEHPRQCTGVFCLLTARKTLSPLVSQWLDKLKDAEGVYHLLSD